jgi:WD40 repeat protein
VWRLPALEPICTLNGHSSSVNNVSFSGDDAFIASASSDRTLRVWSASGCTQTTALRGHQGDVLCVYFSQSDTGHYIVTGSTDRTVKIWDWRSGAELKTLRGHTGAVTGVAYSYNDSLIASCGDDMQVLVWSPSQQLPVIPLVGPPHTAPCTSVLFSFDSRYLASADRDGFVKVWSLPQGQLLRTIDAHDGYCSDITFAADNTTLISAGHDGAIRVWNVVTGIATDSLQLGVPIWSIDVTSDGKTVIAGCSDGTLRIWERTAEKKSPPIQKKR